MCNESEKNIQRALKKGGTVAAQEQKLKI